MAILSDADRKRVRMGLCRYWSSLFETFGTLSKVQLRDAVNATDGWIDTNEGSFNSTLPVAAQTQLTQAQKTLLFCAVALARVSTGFLRRILGEVD